MAYGAGKSKRDASRDEEGSQSISAQKGTGLLPDLFQ
jgi:hypothetical protein